MKKLLSIIAILTISATPLSQQIERKPAYVFSQFKLEGDSILKLFYTAYYGPDSSFCKKAMKIKIKGKNLRIADTSYSARLIQIPERDSIPDTNFVK